MKMLMLALPDLSQLLDWLKQTLKPDNAVIVFLSVLPAVILALEYFFQPIRKLFSFLRNLWRMVNHQPTIPRRTMLITPQAHNLWLSQTLRNEEPATELIGDWHITNITKRPIFLLRVEITSPHKARTIGFLPRGDQAAIQPDQLPVRIHVIFIIQPTVHRQGKPFKATIVFFDQFNNKHRVKNNIFSLHLALRSKQKTLRFGRRVFSDKEIITKLGILSI
jgi:hypothetical protein